MAVRMGSILFVVVLLWQLPVSASKKKKDVVPDYLLKAQTVLVVIPPDAAEPLTDPKANRTALENVEKAILKWGRFRLVMDPMTADLVIAVQKGHPDGPAVVNSPQDKRPVIFEQDDGYTRIGVQQGHPPNVTDPGLGRPDDNPRVKNQVGHQEDSFEVYRGGIDYPLDTIAVYRLINKDILDAPRVVAVEQFRKMIEDAEKQHQKKP